MFITVVITIVCCIVTLPQFAQLQTRNLRSRISNNICLRVEADCSSLSISTCLPTETNQRISFDSENRIIVGNGQCNSKCLSPTSIVSSALVTVTTCNTDIVQKWQWISVDETIRPQSNTSLCLDINLNNQPVIQPCSSSTSLSQKWFRSFQCPPGSQATVEMDFCDSCPSGTIKNYTGSIFDKCTPCPTGLAPNEDMTECIKCPYNRCNWSFHSFVYAGDGTGAVRDGQGTLARFNGPHSITVNDDDNIYVSEWNSGTLRMINSTGYVSTVAGNGTLGYADNIGTRAMFNNPTAVLFHNQHKCIYMTDNANNRIRKIDLNGQVSTVAGNGSRLDVDGPFETASLDRGNIMTTNDGNLLLTTMASPKIRFLNFTSRRLITLADFKRGGVIDGDQSIASWEQLLGNGYDKDKNIIFRDSSYMIRIAIDVFGKKEVRTVSPGIFEYEIWQIVYNPVVNRIFLCDRAKNRIAFFTGNFVPVIIAETGTPLNSLTSIHNDKYGNLYTVSISNGRIIKTIACPPFSLFNSTTQQCDCLPGYQFRAPNFCDPCGPGSIKTVISSRETCTTCPVHYEANANLTDCISCPVGKYRYTLEKSSGCYSCPSGANCTLDDFTCQPGYQPKQNVIGCEKCPLNKYKNVHGNSPCLDCFIGTDSSADSTVCKECISGFYRELSTQKECTPCPLYSECRGAAFTCHPGFYRNGTQSQECIKCPAEHYKSSKGNEECTQCPDGSYPNDIHTKCVKCQVGFYEITSGVCERCPGGQESNGDRSRCVACSQGMYKPPNFLICINCPSGADCSGDSFTCRPGFEISAQMTSCRKCLLNHWKKDGGNSECTKCQLGFISNEERTECIKCQTGYFRPSDVHETCIACPAYSNCNLTDFVCLNGYDKDPINLKCNPRVPSDESMTVDYVASTKMLGETNSSWISENITTYVVVLISGFVVIVGLVSLVYGYRRFKANQEARFGIDSKSDITYSQSIIDTPTDDYTFSDADDVRTTRDNILIK